MKEKAENCRCGHPRRLHRNVEGMDGRDPCRGEVRQFLGRVPDHLRIHMRDSDVELTKEQASLILKELQEQVRVAPNYEGRLTKMLKKSFRIITCTCPMYHTVDIGGVKLHKPGEKNLIVPAKS